MIVFLNDNKLKELLRRDIVFSDIFKLLTI